jgi:hypothetical protein
MPGQNLGGGGDGRTAPARPNVTVIGDQFTSLAEASIAIDGNDFGSELTVTSAVLCVLLYAGDEPTDYCPLASQFPGSAGGSGRR